MIHLGNSTLWLAVMIYGVLLIFKVIATEFNCSSGMVDQFLNQIICTLSSLFKCNIPYWKAS